MPFLACLFSSSLLALLFLPFVLPDFAGLLVDVDLLDLSLQHQLDLSLPWHEAHGKYTRRHTHGIRHAVTP